MKSFPCPPFAFGLVRYNLCLIKGPNSLLVMSGQMLGPGINLWRLKLKTELTFVTLSQLDETWLISDI